jgi:hypothetical protein
MVKPSMSVSPLRQPSNRALSSAVGEKIRKAKNGFKSAFKRSAD